jgi:hypothetical protein
MIEPSAPHLQRPRAESKRGGLKPPRFGQVQLQRALLLLAFRRSGRRALVGLPGSLLLTGCDQQQQGGA